MKNLNGMFIILLSSGVWTGVSFRSMAAEVCPDVWRFDSDGAAISELDGRNSRGCVLDMHGQCVLMHLEFPTPLDAEPKMVLGWPILRERCDWRSGTGAP